MIQLLLVQHLHQQTRHHQLQVLQFQVLLHLIQGQPLQVHRLLGHQPQSQVLLGLLLGLPLHKDWIQFQDLLQVDLLIQDQ